MTETVPPAPEEELKLAPADPDDEAIRGLKLERPFLPGVPAPVSEPSKHQFKIWHLMLATLIVATTVTLAEWISVQIVAGVVGVFALLTLEWSRRTVDHRPKLNLLFVLVFLIYLSMATYLTIRFVLGF